MNRVKFRQAGFTLVELLIVVAIIGILVVAVTLTLNPTKRIRDAQTASLQASVSSAGSEFNLCMNYYNSTTASQNGYANCDSFSKLTSSATPGGPYLKSAPPESGWVFQLSSGGGSTDGCLYNWVTVASVPIYVQYESISNLVKTYDAAPSCP